MDEALELVDLLADLGLEGAVAWVFRLFGALTVLAGIGIWLVTDLPLLVPAGLVVVGVLLIAIPGLVLELAELAG